MGMMLSGSLDPSGSSRRRIRPSRRRSRSGRSLLGSRWCYRLSDGLGRRRRCRTSKLRCQLLKSSTAPFDSLWSLTLRRNVK